MKIGSLVFVRGYEELGVGKVEYINENDEYPIFVHFLNKNIHESENGGCFGFEQINHIKGSR